MMSRHLLECSEPRLQLLGLFFELFQAQGIQVSIWVLFIVFVGGSWGLRARRLGSIGARSLSPSLGWFGLAYRNKLTVWVAERVRGVLETLSGRVRIFARDVMWVAAAELFAGSGWETTSILVDLEADQLDGGEAA